MLLSGKAGILKPRKLIWFGFVELFTKNYLIFIFDYHNNSKQNCKLI